MNNIICATKDLLRNYFRLKGRLSRAGYWWAFLGYAILAVICSILNVILNVEIFTGILSLIFFIPWFTAAARRYHDCGRSTQFLVLLYVLQGVFGFLALGSTVAAAFGVFSESAGIFGGSLIALAVGVIGTLVVGIVMLVGLVKSSDPGANRFGEPNPFDPTKE